MKDWQRLLQSEESGFYVRIHTEPRRFDLSSIDWKNRVIFENENFLIYHKPSALPCHPMVDNIQENLLSELQRQRQGNGGENIFLTHRLDVATQGLMLFAKTAEFRSRFNLLLQNRQVQKYYVAMVEGSPSWGEGTELTHHMLVSPRAPKVLVRQAQENTQECRLQILEVDGSLLKLELLTGRTHQIRAQLSFEGFPIVGDSAYGAQGGEPEVIALQAYHLSFSDQGTEWSFTAPIALENFSVRFSNL